MTERTGWTRDGGTSVMLGGSVRRRHGTAAHHAAKNSLAYCIARHTQHTTNQRTTSADQRRFAGIATRSRRQLRQQHITTRPQTGVSLDERAVSSRKGQWSNLRFPDHNHRLNGDHKEERTSAWLYRYGFVKWELTCHENWRYTSVRTGQSRMSPRRGNVSQLFVVYVRVDASDAEDARRGNIARSSRVQHVTFFGTGRWLCKRSNHAVPRRRSNNPRRQTFSHHRANLMKMTKSNQREIVIAGPVHRTARISWDASWPVSEINPMKGRVRPGRCSNTLYYVFVGLNR